MEKVNAKVNISFVATCPYCKQVTDIKDNWDATETYPLMDGMVDRFTNEFDKKDYLLVSEDDINNIKDSGYENPYACEHCGRDFEIEKVEY